MVKGLEIFSEHFKGYTDNYIIIGGVAASISMEKFGASFRTTKDIDIVLTIEILNKEFAEVFWDFIRKGKYQNQ